jgi:quercetin dioxygenase-like cupin family protein
MTNAAFATPRPWRPRTVLALIVGGIAALAVSATAIALPSAAGDRKLAALPAQPDIFTLSSQDVSVVNQVYEPGQDSGWHAHSGIHAVAVLSGTLTVYDGQCRVQTVEPGRPYVGGQDVHRVRNETAEPIEMVVTYLAPRVAADSSRHVAAPPC